MTEHVGEARLDTGFSAEVSRAKVGAKGEAHFNLLGPDDVEAVPEEVEPVPVNREQRRAAQRRRK